MGSYDMRGRRPPGSFVGREAELAELRAALEGTSGRSHLFLISGEWGIGKIRLTDKLAVDLQRPISPAVVNSAACLHLLILTIAALIFTNLWYVCDPAFADGGNLIALAASQFHDLSKAETRLLEYVDAGNQNRGEWAVCGTSADPKDPSNNPADAASWTAQRNVRAELIRWLTVDRRAVPRVDPKGIRAIGARIVGNLDLSQLHVPFPIALVRCSFGEIHLDGTELPSFDLSGSYTTGFHAAAVVVHGPMSLGWDGDYQGGDFHCSGKVYMYAARIDGELCFGGARVQHLKVDPEAWEADKKVAIDIVNSEIKGDLTMCCSFEANGGVIIDNSTIGRSFDALGGRFVNPGNVALEAVNVTVADNVLMMPSPTVPHYLTEDFKADGVVDFTTAQVQGNFLVDHAKFSGKSTEQHGLRAQGLLVRGGFVWNAVTLQSGAFLDLRGAHLGTLLDDAGSWPSPGKLLIDGLIYNGIGSDSPRDVASRLRWLRLQPGFFSQPYHQLANWMRENGDDTGASKVLAAKAEAEVESSEQTGKSTMARQSLGKSLPALIRVVLILATLLVIASPYVSRRNRKRANASLPASPSPKAAFEINGRFSRDQRRTEPVETESPTNYRSSSKARQTTAALQNNTVDECAIFRREGDYWTVSYRDSAFRLKDVKGLAYIAFLLGHPGERIHVHELIARVDGVAERGSELRAEIAREVSPASDLGDAGDAIDPQAQADYRRKLRELAEDLEEAEGLNDIGRAERIRMEAEFLKEELSAAVGIGGRNRKAAAHAERARGMVSKNIRAGLEKIRGEDAVLAHHFAASIKTGYYCAYLPDPERKISWQL